MCVGILFLAATVEDLEDVLVVELVGAVQAGTVDGSSGVGVNEVGTRVDELEVGMDEVEMDEFEVEEERKTRSAGTELDGCASGLGMLNVPGSGISMGGGRAVVAPALRNITSGSNLALLVLCCSAIDSAVEVEEGGRIEEEGRIEEVVRGVISGGM